jgi:hypothetical protein
LGARAKPGNCTSKIIFGACVILFYFVFALVCSATFDLNPDPESSAYKTMLAWYWAYLLMLLGVSDTILHVARKKYNRVTNGHIFTSTSSMLYMWVHTRYMPYGPETMDVMFLCNINCLVHFYYMLSSMGSDIRPYLWWKQHLSTYQAAQGLFSPFTKYLSEMATTPLTLNDGRKDSRGSYLLRYQLPFLFL